MKSLLRSVFSFLFFPGLFGVFLRGDVKKFAARVPVRFFWFPRYVSERIFTSFCLDVCRQIEAVFGQKISFSVQSQKIGVCSVDFFSETVPFCPVRWALSKEDFLGRTHYRLNVSTVNKGTIPFCAGDVAQLLWVSQPFLIAKDYFRPVQSTSEIQQHLEKVILSLVPYFLSVWRQNFLENTSVGTTLESVAALPEVVQHPQMFEWIYKIFKGHTLHFFVQSDGVKVQLKSVASFSQYFGRCADNNILYDGELKNSILELKSSLNKILFALDVSKSKLLELLKRNRHLDIARYFGKLDGNIVKFVFPAIDARFKFLLLEVTADLMTLRIYWTEQRFTLIEVNLSESYKQGQSFPSDKTGQELFKGLKRFLSGIAMADPFPTDLLSLQLLTHHEQNEPQSFPEPYIRYNESHGVDLEKAYRQNEDKALKRLAECSLTDPVGLFLQQTFTSQGALRAHLEVSEKKFSAEFYITEPRTTVTIHWAPQQEGEEVVSRVAVHVGMDKILDETLTELKNIGQVSMVLAKLHQFFATDFVSLRH